MVLESATGSKRGGLDGSLGTIVNFMTGCASDTAAVCGGMLASIEAFETPGVESTSSDCRENE